MLPSHLGSSKTLEFKSIQPKKMGLKRVLKFSTPNLVLSIPNSLVVFLELSCTFCASCQNMPTTIAPPWKGRPNGRNGAPGEGARPSGSWGPRCRDVSTMQCVYAIWMLTQKYGKIPQIIHLFRPGFPKKKPSILEVFPLFLETPISESLNVRTCHLKFDHRNRNPMY